MAESYSAVLGSAMAAKTRNDVESNPVGLACARHPQEPDNEWHRYNGRTKRICVDVGHQSRPAVSAQCKGDQPLVLYDSGPANHDEDTNSATDSDIPKAGFIH